MERGPVFRNIRGKGHYRREHAQNRTVENVPIQTHRLHQRCSDTRRTSVPEHDPVRRDCTQNDPRKCTCSGRIRDDSIVPCDGDRPDRRT
eukprot:scaffold6655_cov169-Amphora_coffeaeformis.AAC.33